MPDHSPVGVNIALSYRLALGFDFGRVRIGVAVGEVVTGSARPLRTLPARQQCPDWDAIAHLIAEWRPDVLVIGAPRHADGTANAITEAALRFGRQLHGRFRLPVEVIDERLSSWEAGQRCFESASAGRRRSRDTTLDAQAAAVILESWFNQQRSLALSCTTPNS